MSVKCLSLKCLSKIITFHISSWLVDDSTVVSGFELVSYIKVSNIDVFGSFTAGFPSIFSSWITLILSCSMVTSDPRGFKGKFISTNHNCDSKKCFIHTTKVMGLPTPTSQLSVEHLVLIFCFVDIDSILPCPKIRQAPV